MAVTVKDVGLTGTIHYGWGGALGGLAGVYGADMIRGHHKNHGHTHSMWGGGGYFLGYLLYTWMRNMQAAEAKPYLLYNQASSAGNKYHVSAWDGNTLNVPILFGPGVFYEVSEADIAGLAGLTLGSWYSGHLSLYSFLSSAAGAEFGKMLGTYGMMQVHGACLVATAGGATVKVPPG